MPQNDHWWEPPLAGTEAEQLAGAPPGAPWDTADWDADPDWDFTSAAYNTPEELYALWDAAVERSAARLAAALAAERGSRVKAHGHERRRACRAGATG
ncbi:hypothetical protein [Nonomuraea sp. NPDC050783]|uniref:hypothetical protein n=1 Tax=Nonomuraea sp. NPDC050783 TaxID=3154634 RepID=UPI0034652F77